MVLSRRGRSVSAGVAARPVLTTTHKNGNGDQQDGRKHESRADLDPAWGGRSRGRSALVTGGCLAIRHAQFPFRGGKRQSVLIIDIVSCSCRTLCEVPKLWTDTIESHREEVHRASLDAVGELVADGGLRVVTMGKVAVQAGIGRATLYKYFPTLEAILLAWHQRQIDSHLEQLTRIRDQHDGPQARLAAVFEAYAMIQFERPADALASALHRGPHMAGPVEQLQDFIGALLSEAMGQGELRDDVPASELTVYCLQALGAASSLRSKAAVRRLVAVTLAGLTVGR